MKKVGIISDTHGFLDQNLKKYFSTCDLIIHAGDIGDMKVTNQLSEWSKVRAVYGNIDGSALRIEFPEYLILDIENCKILLIHIAGKMGTYNQKVKTLLQENSDINCLICGHSHILKVQYDSKNSLLYINPGASGRHGFHLIRTALILEINGEKIENLQIIELGKRASI